MHIELTSIILLHSFKKLLKFPRNFLFNQIQEGKYIFIYGGVDEEWRKQFAKRVEALAKDYVIQHAKISIVLSCVEMGCKGKDGRLQKFLSSRTHKNTECGWVVLSKGSKLVDGGNGTTILKVLEEFNKWRWRVRESTMFEICFKDYHKEVIHNGEDWFGYFMIEHFREPKFSTLVKLFSHIQMHKHPNFTQYMHIHIFMKGILQLTHL